MKTVLEYYEIYPKVVPSHAVSEVTIRPLGRHVEFAEGETYTVIVTPMDENCLGVPGEEYPAVSTRAENGVLRFSIPFGEEQQYALTLSAGEKKEFAELRVYAADEDLYALTPFRGDMHCHTCRSDGIESPEIVAANYRKAGFDFLSITDHRQYAPSLEAIEAYKDVPIDLKLFPGEEVHPPENNSHIIHFGGDYSINEIFLKEPERYRREVNEIARGLNLPEGVDPVEYASCMWVCKNIRAAGGLAVLAHPCWIQWHAYHLKQKSFRCKLETHLFDALELTCGQSLEENQMQVSAWQQARADGYSVPIVGSSDSHGTVNSEWFNLSKMVMLARSSGRDDLIEAAKAGRAVVLEQYHGEKLPRVYGVHRYASFVLFLVTEYFPMHDELCFEEGRLMKEYACGSGEAAELLAKMHGRTARLIRRYWGRN